VRGHPHANFFPVRAKKIHGWQKHTNCPKSNEKIHFYLKSTQKHFTWPRGGHILPREDFVPSPDVHMGQLPPHPTQKGDV